VTAILDTQKGVALRVGEVTVRLTPKAHRTPLCQWFGEAENTLRDFAQEAGVDTDQAVAWVETRLRHCRATTRDKFVLWAAKLITKHPDYRGSLEAIKKLDLDVLDLLNRAEQAYDFKPMNTEKTASTMFVDMGKVGGEHRIWKLPMDQTVIIRREKYSWAEVAEKLWPCYLRKVGAHYQVAKKISGQPLHVARILIGARDDEMVKFDNGDSLDYTAGNVYVVSDRRGSTAQEEQEKFEANICKYGTNANLENIMLDPTDAKAKRPKGAGPVEVDPDRIGRELRSGDYRGSGSKIAAIVPKKDYDEDGNEDAFNETVAKDLAPEVSIVETSKLLHRDQNK
jgi:hypothetical protein